MVNPFKTPNISIIVAVANNNVIGKDNALLWHISDDLKRFKALTSGHAVIMGRKTWMSLPRRPLPKRRNIVLTRNADFNDDGAVVAHSLQRAIDMVSDEEESFVMGGADIYRQFLPVANRIYLTRLMSDFEGDAYFPVIDYSVFGEVSRSELFKDAESGLDYYFCDLVRRPVPQGAVFNV